MESGWFASRVASPLPGRGDHMEVLAESNFDTEIVPATSQEELPQHEFE